MQSYTSVELMIIQLEVLPVPVLVLVDDQFVIQVRFAIRSAGQVRPHLIMIIQT